MRPILFTLGSLPISSFFLSIFLGTLIAVFYGMRIARKNGLRPEVLLDMGMIGLISGILGARIFHILVEFPGYYWEKPARVFQFGQGGFVSWGTMIAVPLSLIVYFHIRKLSILPYADLAGVIAPILKFFVRVACLLAGCCYGRASDLPWAIVFQNKMSAANYFMGEVPLHPTQVYSMIHALLLFLFARWLYTRRRFVGETLCLSGMAWTLPRTLIEFFRGDEDRGIFLGVISTGQIMGIAGFIFFVILYYKLRGRRAA